MGKDDLGQKSRQVVKLKIYLRRICARGYWYENIEGRWLPDEITEESPALSAKLRCPGIDGKLGGPEPHKAVTAP